MEVNFFPYKDFYLKDKDNFIDLIDNVLGRGAYILQKDCSEFEESSKKFLNCKDFITVANGTDALIILLRAAGIGLDDEVIIPSHTYIATAASVYYVGAKIVLADIGEDKLINPNSIESLITEKTKCIMPVHVNGRICNMDAIMKIAEKYNLIVVEDAAQAYGAKFKGKSAGTFGLGGGISFYPAKVLGCFGDGGAIVTNNAKISNAARLLRDHGRDESGEIKSWGLNSRLDNVQAAILNYKLKKFPEEILRRREIANLYYEGLKSCYGITYMPIFKEKDDNYDIFQNFEICCKDRDSLKDFLMKNNIKTIIQWAGMPVHQSKLSNINQNSYLPETDKFFEECLMLPMYPLLSNKEIHFVIEKIVEFYA